MLGNDGGTLAARCGKCGCDRSKPFAAALVGAPLEAALLGAGAMVAVRCRGCGRLGGTFTYTCTSGHLHVMPLDTEAIRHLIELAEADGTVRYADGAEFTADDEGTMDDEDAPTNNARPAAWADDPWKDIQSLLERAFNGGGDDD